MKNAQQPPWVTLLALKVDRDANEWLAERRKYGQTLRGLAAEISDLIGHPISYETVRRQLGDTEENAEDKAVKASAKAS